MGENVFEVGKCILGQTQYKNDETMPPPLPTIGDGLAGRSGSNGRKYGSKTGILAVNMAVLHKYGRMAVIMAGMAGMAGIYGSSGRNDNSFQAISFVCFTLKKPI